jgi:LysR substrate binding domain
MWADLSPPDIVASGFDAGIGPKRWAASDVIGVRLTGPVKIAVVGAPTYFAGRRPPRTPDDLTSHNCIQYRLGAKGPLSKWQFEHNGKTRQIAVTGRLSVNTPELAIRAVLEGLGVAYLPEETFSQQSLLSPEPHLRDGDHFIQPEAQSRGPRGVAELSSPVNATQINSYSASCNHIRGIGPWTSAHVRGRERSSRSMFGPIDAVIRTIDRSSDVGMPDVAQDHECFGRRRRSLRGDDC